MNGNADPLIKFTFLGQAGFLIRDSSHEFLIDPYLSNYVVDSGIGPAEVFSREFPAPMSPADLKEVGLLFITHNHGDHCDPDTLLPLYRENPDRKFVCSKPAGEHLISLGIDAKKVIIPSIGTLMVEDGVMFYAVPAAHYNFDRDETDGSYAYLGYVIQLNGIWIYHAGDTLLYDGMVDGILKHTDRIDVACLPVNGRDGWRESMDILGNLDGAESLELALRLHADVILPMHNDLFKTNHATPAFLADVLDRKAPRQKVHWLQPGEKYFYSK